MRVAKAALALHSSQVEAGASGGAQKRYKWCWWRRRRKLPAGARQSTVAEPTAN